MLAVVSPEVDGDYQLSSDSRYFPDTHLAPLVTEYLQISRDQSTSAAIRNLRQQLN